MYDRVDGGSDRFTRKVPSGGYDLLPAQFRHNQKLQFSAAFLFVAAAVGQSSQSLARPVSDSRVWDMGSGLDI